MACFVVSCCCHLVLWAVVASAGSAADNTCAAGHGSCDAELELLHMMQIPNAVMMYDEIQRARRSRTSEANWHLVGGTYVHKAPVHPEMCTKEPSTSPCFDGGLNKQAFEIPIKKFEARQPFTLMRYNDGEWYAMRDYELNQGDWMCANCDSLPCSRRMVEAFRNVLTDSSIAQAAPPQATKYIVQSSLYWEGWDTDYKQWGVQPSLFTLDTIHGYVRDYPDLLERFVRAIEPYQVTVVGPCVLRRLCQQISYDKFLEIPLQHFSASEVDQTIDQVYTELASAMDKPSAPTMVVLISGSMMTNAIGAKLWNHSKDKHFVIDIGSAFDPLFDATSDASLSKSRGTIEKVNQWRSAYLNPSAELITTLTEGAKPFYKDAGSARSSLRSWVFGKTGGHDCASKCHHILLAPA